MIMKIRIAEDCRKAIRLGAREYGVKRKILTCRRHLQNAL